MRKVSHLKGISAKDLWELQRVERKSLTLRPTEAVTPCSICGAKSAFLVADRCRGGERLNTVLCDQCGLVRRDPMPSPEELQRYYSSSYRVEIGKGKRPSPRRLCRIMHIALERALDLVARLPQNARTLDVGCGAGDLVYLLQSAGFDAHGFDPDSRYIEWARSIIGDVVEEHRIEDFHAPSSFDLVTMYHALEHMPNPGYTLDRIREWLRHDGLLVIEVPNVEARNQAPGNQYIKPHVHYFNIATLSMLAAQNGFELEHAGTYATNENVRCYLRKRREAQGSATNHQANAQKMRALLQGHKSLSHYATATPYSRSWAKMCRTVAEHLRTMGKSDREIMSKTAEELRFLTARK